MADLTSDKICNLKSVCYSSGIRCCALGCCVEGSQTQKSKPELIEKLQHSRNLNSQYLTKKWGPCLNAKFPFDDKDIFHTTYDLEFVRQKYLGF